MRRTVNENPCNALGLCDTIAAGKWQPLACEFLFSKSGHADKIGNQSNLVNPMLYLRSVQIVRLRTEYLFMDISQLTEKASIQIGNSLTVG